MVKSNEPCPCGSGKKYGMCCGKEKSGKTCPCGSGKPAAKCCGA